MKLFIHVLFVIGLGSLLISCTHHRGSAVNTTPMPDVDIKRYMGEWYEIARLPNRFEKGLSHVVASYALKSNGRIMIYNSGYTVADEFHFVNGQGYIPNPAVQGHLKVSFVMPYYWFYGDYNILYVNSDYTLALVSGSDAKYLWLLSRSKTISERDRQDLLGIARARGFDTKALIWRKGLKGA